MARFNGFVRAAEAKMSGDEADGANSTRFSRAAHNPPTGFWTARAISNLRRFDQLRKTPRLGFAQQRAFPSFSRYSVGAQNCNHRLCTCTGR